jgi:hypothetical protein
LAVRPVGGLEFRFRDNLVKIRPVRGCYLSGGNQFGDKQLRYRLGLVSRNALRRVESGRRDSGKFLSKGGRAANTRQNGMNTFFIRYNPPNNIFLARFEGGKFTGIPAGLTPQVFGIRAHPAIRQDRAIRLK